MVLRARFLQALVSTREGSRNRSRLLLPVFSFPDGRSGPDELRNLSRTDGEVWSPPLAWRVLGIPIQFLGKARSWKYAALLVSLLSCAAIL